MRMLTEEMPSSGERVHQHEFKIDLEEAGPNNTVLAFCPKCGESKWVPRPKQVNEGRSGKPLLLG